MLEPAVEAIGRPEIKGKTHVFRHTAGALVQREATTQVVQAAMGHSDYSTTFEVYGHMQAGITDLAAEAIDRQVAAAGAPTTRVNPWSTVRDIHWTARNGRVWCSPLGIATYACGESEVSVIMGG